MREDMDMKHPRTSPLTQAILTGLGLAGALTFSPMVMAAGTLDKLTYSSLSDGGMQIRLTLSEAPAAEPAHFSVDNPSRIAIDLSDVTNALSKRTESIQSAGVRDVVIAETEGRTRAVINLDQSRPYTLTTEGNDVVITLAGGKGAESAAAPGASTETLASQFASNTADAAVQSINIQDQHEVDFRRGTAGEGFVQVNLPEPNVPMNIKSEGRRLLVDLPTTHLTPGKYDVRDFSSTVDEIQVRSKGKGSQLVLLTNKNAGEHLSWQTDNRLTVEVKPIPKETKDAPGAPKKYTGERLTLKFQDIEIRPLLQLLADFTGNNIVVADSVSGSMSLRLDNVPWDQALDLILTTKGLDKRVNGNVIFVAPMEELAARDKAELEAKKQTQELAPLVTELVQINYAKAGDIARLLQAGDKEKGKFLSERGSITIDERTNNLIVHDVPDSLDRIRNLIAQLDTPIKQVLIEARIVIATDNFSKELGVRWGVTAAVGNGANGMIGTTGGAEGLSRDAIYPGASHSATNGMIGTGVLNNMTTGSPFPTGIPAQSDRWNVNLPVTNPAGSLALAVLGSNVLLDLELSALQAEGEGQIVSSPKVITANGHKAIIKQGQEIPYQSTATAGGVAITQVTFKEAVLAAEVTPQITPNDNIILDIMVKKDEADYTRLLPGSTNPPLNKREVNTKVQVKNGETVVLGGIYELSSEKSIDKVPFLGDIPGLGELFKRNGKKDRRFELLIFVTPKIVDASSTEIARN